MSREIIKQDALVWLRQQPNQSVDNFVTGICDLDETDEPGNMGKYLNFFREVTQLVLSKLHPDGYAVFIQTDRKYQRQWIDKSHIISKIARGFDVPLKMVWHKIVLHRGVNRTDLHRPTYAHMLCYSRNGTTGEATPDVLPVSTKLYKNGTPVGAAESAIKFIKRYSKSGKTVVDPFVGQGTIPAIANYHGLNAIGIDIDAKQVDIARKMIYHGSN